MMRRKDRALGRMQITHVSLTHFWKVWVLFVFVMGVVGAFGAGVGWWVFDVSGGFAAADELLAKVFSDGKSVEQLVPLSKVVLYGGAGTFIGLLIVGLLLSVGIVVYNGVAWLVGGFEISTAMWKKSVTLKNTTNTNSS